MCRQFEGRVIDIEPIKTQGHSRRVPKEFESLMMAKRNTPEAIDLMFSSRLVEAWERQHYPLALLNPVEAIKYQMQQNGL
jgi:HTH-type transcriptional regulator/antitoxin HigA